MQKGERLDGGRGRSRGRLAGRSRQAPALAVSALVAGQQPTVGRGQGACPGLLTGPLGPVMRSHAGSLQAADPAGPSPRAFPHNSLSLPGAGSWEPGEAERGAGRSGWADRGDWGRVRQIRSFSHPPHAQLPNPMATGTELQPQPAFPHFTLAGFMGDICFLPLNILFLPLKQASKQASKKTNKTLTS